MKKLVTIALIATGFSFSTFAQPSPTEKEVSAPISEVLIPSELVATQETKVAVSGVFANACYRWKKAEVTHSEDYLHQVRATAVVSQGMCLMVLVPFNKEVNLGILQAGKHTVRFVNDDGTYLEKSFTVKE